jgi:polysaccharide biosynthesis transport protein
MLLDSFRLRRAELELRWAEALLGLAPAGSATEMSNSIAPGEEPIDLRRSVAALRRGLPLIVVIVLALGVSTYLVSHALPNHYKAESSLVLQDLTTDQSNDSLTRQLNTVSSLVVTDPILQAAAAKLPGETLSSLRDNVSSRVDPNANLVFITATDRSRSRSADIANAVADASVASHADSERRQAQLARAELRQEIARLRNRRGQEPQVQALEQRLSELGVGAATAGADLAVAERATAPDNPSSPHPLRNTALAVVLGLFVGVLVVLGRDQLAPRIGGPRDLSALLELPLLASVPYVGRRRRKALSGAEYEAYQGLAASVRFTLAPGDGPHVLLVTSALHGEGKSTVTARLGAALAHAGARTLVVSADLRRPTLHQLLGVPLGPGLSDILATLAGRSSEDARSLIEDHIRSAPGRQSGELDVLASGRVPADPGNVLGDVPLEILFARLGELGYAYVVVDTPALLGIADTRALARHCTRVLYVARLDLITPEKATDARHALDLIDRTMLGMVTIGGRAEASPYYVSGPLPTFEEA